MKILLISNMWPGTRKPHFGTFVAERANAYRRNGAEVHVVANRDPRSGLSTAVKYALLSFRAVVVGIRRRPDVIEGHYLAPTAVITWAVASLLRRPYVLYAHGSDVDSRLPGLGFAVRHAALVFTNSADTAERIRDRFPSAPEVVVVPPGVDLARFATVSRPTPDTPDTVGFLGDLVRHKGGDVLVEAVGVMSPQPRLIIGGDGPDDSVLRSQVDSLGLDVEWRGALRPDDVPAFFADIDVLAVPSRRDALGMVAVEALASGVPVVVSRVGGLAGVPTLACGESVPPDDVDALATALRRWLNRRFDPAVASAARARARDFDADALAKVALARLREASGMT